MRQYWRYYLFSFLQLTSLSLMYDDGSWSRCCQGPGMRYGSSSGHDCPPWARVTNYWAALLSPGSLTWPGVRGLVRCHPSQHDTHSRVTHVLVTLTDVVSPHDVYIMSAGNSTPRSRPHSQSSSHVSLSVELSKYIIVIMFLSLWTSPCLVSHCRFCVISWRISFIQSQVEY